MTTELPCVVWVDTSPGTQYGPDPCFGLLLERRQRAGPRDTQMWEGFVVMGKAPDERHGVSIRAEWVSFRYLTLVDAPRPPKRGAPPLKGPV